MSQVKFIRSVLLCGAAALALSACSSSDSGGSTVTTPTVPTVPMNAFQTMGAANDVVEGRVTALPGSSFSAVPSTGDAIFVGTGNVTMVLDADTDSNFRAVGDANVTVNFLTETVTGGLTNLMGAVGTEAEVNAASAAATLIDVDGSIALSRLNIYERGDGGLTARYGNRFGISYGGTLTADGTDYVVAGRQEGGETVGTSFEGNQFKGTFVEGTEGVRIRAIQIESASDTFATVTNGDGTTSTFAGTIGIYGENR